MLYYYIIYIILLFFLYIILSHIYFLILFFLYIILSRIKKEAHDGEINLVNLLETSDQIDTKNRHENICYEKE